MVEYALLAGFLGMAIITAAGTLEAQIYDIVNTVVEALGLVAG